MTIISLHTLTPQTRIKYLPAEPLLGSCLVIFLLPTSEEKYATGISWVRSCWSLVPAVPPQKSPCLEAGRLDRQSLRIRLCFWGAYSWAPTAATVFNTYFLVPHLCALSFSHSFSLSLFPKMLPPRRAPPQGSLSAPGSRLCATKEKA